MAELGNCRICGKPIIASEAMLCNKCYREREEKFEKVRGFLRILPGARVSEIAEGTKVEEETILEFLREGRLSLLHPDPSADLKCKECKKPITTGLYCDECRKKVLEALGETTGWRITGRYYSKG